MRWGGSLCQEGVTFPAASAASSPAPPPSQGSWSGSRRAWCPTLTITVISCLEGGRGLQVAAQGPVTTVTVVQATVDVHRVLGVGGGWQ